MDLKHIDPTPPIDLIKTVFEQLKAGTWNTLDFVLNVAYLLLWAVDFLRRKLPPDGPVFGNTPEEAEFCAYCVKIHDWASDGDVVIQQSAIGAWLVKAMLLALLNRILRELATNGIPDWLAELIQNIKDQIEAL